MPMVPAQLETILDKLPEPILIIGPDQRILLANSNAAELFAMAPLGQHLLSFIRQPEVLQAVQSVLAGAALVEARYVSRRSVDMVYKVVVSALSPENSGINGAIATFSDLTQIEASQQIRSDFVANVSHELRSPLTALSGFIETLQGPASEDGEARAEFLRIMQAEADRMRRLIDDLLSLSRVEVDERLRPTTRVDIVEKINAVCSNLAPVAARHKVTVSLQNTATHADVAADSDQLIQVFQNLIENAIKYGGGSDVAVKVSEAGKYIGVLGPVLRVDIRDHGPGIAPVHIPRLTERFYRVDNHRSRGLGGTGLGLAIVKHIISRHRGRLIIQSHPGEGSVFSVILPKT